jgi:hypothetical protein
MQHEHGHDRVELEHGAFQPQAHWHLSQRPALGHPESHDRHEDQRHGDRYAFEILRLAGRILGHHGDGYVEARETGQAAEDEEGEQEVVERRAQTETEGSGSGSDAEGDLHGVLAIVLAYCFREGTRTKSARESNSCPIRLAFFLHLATLPSMKSKNRPRGTKPNAR